MIKLTITIDSSPHPTLAGSTISTSTIASEVAGNVSELERTIAGAYVGAIYYCNQMFKETGHCQPIVTAHGEDACDKARRIIDGMKGVN